MKALILLVREMPPSLSRVLFARRARGSSPVSTRDENRTGTFMRQMRGENTGPGV